MMAAVRAHTHTPHPMVWSVIFERGSLQPAACSSLLPAAAAAYSGSLQQQHQEHQQPAGSSSSSQWSQKFSYSTALFSSYLISMSYSMFLHYLSILFPNDLI